MLKRSITYTDFNDEQQTEEFYFNLGKRDIVRLEFSKHEGLEAALRQMIASDNKAEILEIFEQVVLGSYGVKSEDGKTFEKSIALLERFRNSAAYDALFEELITNERTMYEFINAIVPKDLLAKMQAAEQPQDKPLGPPPAPPTQ